MSDRRISVKEPSVHRRWQILDEKEEENDTTPDGEVENALEATVRGCGDVNNSNNKRVLEEVICKGKKKVKKYRKGLEQLEREQEGRKKINESLKEELLDVYGMFAKRKKLDDLEFRKSSIRLDKNKNGRNEEKLEMAVLSILGYQYAQGARFVLPPKRTDIRALVNLPNNFGTMFGEFLGLVNKRFGRSYRANEDRILELKPRNLIENMRKRAKDNGIWWEDKSYLTASETKGLYRGHAEILLEIWPNILRGLVSETDD